MCIVYYSSTSGPEMSKYASTIFFKWLQIVAERGTTQKSIFVYTQNQPKNGFKTSWTRLFFIFCQIFDDFLKFQSIFAVLHFEKSSKNEENPCSTCIQPILCTQDHFQKPEFWKPSPSLSCKKLNCVTVKLEFWKPPN